MSYESVKIITMTAGEDLRNKNFHLLTLKNDNGQARVYLTAATDASEDEYSAAIPVGVVMNLNPFPEPVTTEGRGVGMVQISGGGKVDMIAAKPITAGQIVIPFAAKEENDKGRVIGADDLRSMPSFTFGVGIALKSAGEGEGVNVLLHTITSGGMKNK